MEEIRSANSTSYSAAKKYKVPYATLHDRLRRKHSSQHGKEQILSKDQEEEELVSYVIQCCQEGNPQQTADILSAASKIALMVSRFPPKTS
jgi:hypothetical protein